MKPWSETLTLPKPLRYARLHGRGDEAGAEARAAAEEVRASYERGRREAEQALSQQLFQQRTEVHQLVGGVLNSLRQAVPQIVRDTENTMIALSLSVARKLVAGMPISAVLVETVVRDARPRSKARPNSPSACIRPIWTCCKNPIPRFWAAATGLRSFVFCPRRKSPAGAVWCKPSSGRSMRAGKQNSTFCKGH